LNADDGPVVINAITQLDEACLVIAQRLASEIAAGHVTVLGLGALDVGEPPDWHREACACKSAPRKHWSRVPYLDASVIGDHKILWEVNRQQYLFAPAICWLADGDRRHFELVQRHLESWIECNPPQLGVNWASSLEVAYRAVTWCWLTSLLRSAPWDASLLARLAASLEDHALHVERYLSLYFSPNTHLTGEALGLFMVGSTLSESRHSGRWRQRGAEILESWLDRQIYDDGVYFEQATQYQRYTAEIYLQYLQMAERTAWPVSTRVRGALGNLFDVLRTMADGGGRMPLMGDDDGGLLLPIDHRAPDELRGLLLAGAVALQRPDLVVPGPPQPALSCLLNGVAATERMLSRPASCPAWSNMHFATGGVVAIRDGWEQSGAVCVVDAGPHGAMNCGHAHADALAVTLSLGQQPVIVDRGTLSYIGAARNEYRATASHNTLEFDGESSVLPLGPFQWGLRPQRPTATLRVYDRLTLFRGMANGHAGSGRPSSHERTILHAPGGAWIVIDQGMRAGTTRAVARWQLAPGLVVAESEPGVFDVHDAQSAPLMRLLAPESPSVTVTSRSVSSRYGHHSAAPLIVAQTDRQLRAITLMLPALEAGQLPTVLKTGDVSAQRLCWSDNTGTHVVVVPLGYGGALELKGWQVAADLIWHLSAPEGEVLVAVAVRRLTSPDGNVLVPLTAGPGLRDVVVGRLADTWAIIPFLEPRRGLE
jgi:hypothetical protein